MSWAHSIIPAVLLSLAAAPSVKASTEVIAPAAPLAYVAAGAPVLVELAEPVSSKTHKRGDAFAIRLIAPIELGDKVLVPAGTPGVGQVIDAGRAGALGKPAKLLLAARYLEFNGAQIPLRSFNLGRVGTDTTNAVLVAGFVPYAGILAGFIHGGEIEVPAGTKGQAKLVAAVPANSQPVIPPAAPDHAISASH